jgi:hypothetical protein
MTIIFKLARVAIISVALVAVANMVVRLIAAPTC